MTEDQINDARKSCKNVINNLDSGRFISAEAWADHAADTIRDANIIAYEARRIVEPHDASTTGDKVAVALSVGVLVWMVVSMLAGVWTL